MSRRALAPPCIPSPTELDLIIRDAADSGALPANHHRCGADLRRLFSALADLHFRPGKAAPLQKLCEAGARYGWQELVRNISADSLAWLAPKAKASVRRNLQRELEWVTRSCLQLEWKSFGLAMTSLGLQTGQPDPIVIEGMFLRDRPGHRFLSLCKKFPVLAWLWVELIRQWREQVTEILGRVAADQRALSRSFFNNKPVGRIIDARFSLSDRHNSGRTVAWLRFEAGAIIYKPRSGRGEAEWFSLLKWMNQRGFAPRLRTVRVVPRKDYSWMECVAAAPCKNKAAVCRFYRRMGGLIATSHLLQAVDCHRQNLIAAGEHPVLIDVDALWHLSPPAKTQSYADPLYRTGFFPSADRGSLQSRSSVFGPGRTGHHLPRLGGKTIGAGRYQHEIARGFGNAWRCLVGTKARRAAFARRLRRILTTQRRRIYLATEIYGAILEASLQPGLLRSAHERDLLIRTLCARQDAPSSVIEAEVRALRSLDIPYFVTGREEFRRGRTSTTFHSRTEIVPGNPTSEQFSSAFDAERWRTLLAVRRSR